MKWFGTITLRASATICCPLVDVGRCYEYHHRFVVEQSTTTPLLPDVEKAIREKLQTQLDLIVAKFLEAHK